MKIKVIICILAFALVFIGINDIQANEDGDSDMFKGFDAFVENLMEEKHVPGMAIAVVKDGDVIYKKCYGYRDVENKLAVTPETVFNIGSTTKAFTSTATGMLVQEGKMTFNDLVIDHLPAFRLNDDYSTSHITVRDLLSHKSGLPGHNAVWHKADVTFDHIINNLKYLESEHSFREAFSYNNILYAVAGYLSGKVYGSDWEHLVKEKIFIPLGMDSSGFALEDYEKVDNKAKPYQYDNDKLSEVGYINIGVVGPAGSINSNINDMSKWLLFNLNKGKVGDKQLVVESLMKHLQTPHVVVPSALEYDEESYKYYALGWGVTAYRDHLIVCHDGSIDGFYAHVSFMPKDNIGVVILSNATSSMSSLIYNNVYDRLLGLNQIDWNGRAKEKETKAKAALEKLKQENKKKPVKKSNPSHELEAYAGKYFNPAYGVMVVMKEGKALKANYRTPFSLRHHQYDIFEAYDESDPEETMNITFFMDSNGNISSLSMPLEPEAGSEIKFKKLIEE